MYRSGNSSQYPPHNNNGGGGGGGGGGGYPSYPLSQPSYPEPENDGDMAELEYTASPFVVQRLDDGRFNLPEIPAHGRPFSTNNHQLNNNNDAFLDINDDLSLMPFSQDVYPDSYPDSYPASSPSHASRSYHQPLSPPPPLHFLSYADDTPPTPPLHQESVAMPEPQPYNPYLPEPTEYSPHPPPHAVPSPVDTPSINRGPRYGAPPKRQLRRYRTTKRVQLKDGNLVLDCPVPTKLLQACPHRDHEEFTHMRYTAATCDPNDFIKNKYHLRPEIYKRDTELFIAVTMYNEDEILFSRTMHGIMKNIAHLVSRTRSRTWGEEGWKKIVVCIVSDGRKKCNPRVLSVLASMGVYQDGIAKNMVNGREVTAHIYEYTSQISIDPENLKLKGADKGIVPCQILFCLKEHNKKKLNSHRWFFNAFAPIIKPNVCVLLDVGTRPGNTSIYHLWKAFDINSNVGGACGEIRAMTGKGCSELINPIVAAQNFEYKMSNILDKPLESVFGYISVLPGAFSAYRYIALLPDRVGNGPLTQYFKGETQHGSDADVFTANMYLAEDRILCYELVAKRNSSWVLHYVKSAYGETDVPDAIPEFISQRRRWLNGSFFAAVYSLYHFGNIWRTDHSFLRKLALHLQFLYNFISLLFSWLAMGNFYISFYFIAKSLGDPKMDPFGNGWGDRIFQALRYVYYFLIIVQFISSMGNRPQGSKWTFTLSMVFFAIIMGYMLFAAGYLTYAMIAKTIQDPSARPVIDALFHKSGFRDIMLSLLATYGLYFIVSIMYLDPWHMCTSFVQYMFLLPSYINVLNIYAFCNTHDVSWGTKGDTTVSTDLGVAKSTGSKQGVETVEVELPTAEMDINEAYEEFLADLRRKIEKKRQKRDPKTKQEDYYRFFRTQLVLWWIVCNAVLIAVVTANEVENIFLNEATGAAIYLSVIMWTVAGLAVFRFMGSALYLLGRLLTD